MARGSSASELRPDSIAVDRVEQQKPNDRRAAQMYARLGYSVPEAIADLVDNSIDARATQILVRIVRSAEQILRVLVVDNGQGMDERTLTDAMQLGGGAEKSESELGKYGVGLKLASLSQAKTVTVLSSQKGHGIGRRWTFENIAKGWYCQFLNKTDVTKFMSGDFAPVHPKKRGTIVAWQDLQHLTATPAQIVKTIDRVLREISVDLGLRFHRFLARRQVKIWLDVQMAGEEPSGVQLPVEPLNPFGYSESGRDGYPKTFRVPLGALGSISLECHIWPPNSKDRNYKLGGRRVSSRQGFYFYRNDRLIQMGGWNGVVEDENEPHTSLARVRVDLPARLDSEFKLPVTKSKVEAPRNFVPNVHAATVGKLRWHQYLKDAREAYRKQKEKDDALFKFLPGKGFPAAAREAAKRILWKKGTGKPHLIHFEWRELDPDVFFELDRDNGYLILNNLYRSRVLQSRRASGADAPLIKLLLLLLLQDEFGRKAESEVYREWMQRTNHTLIAMLKKDL